MAGKTVRAMGLMSGTSMDGIDAAILDSDGETIAAFGPTHYQPYSKDDRQLIRQGMDEAVGLSSREDRSGILKACEECITARHQAIVGEMLANYGPVDLIGFHGQTIFHAPDRRLTVQIGDGRKLADSCNIPVVFDLRANDVMRGGQGAPLVPIYHQALALHLGLDLPVAIVNIGGVANVTWIGSEGFLAACDTGPGNALMNDWIKQHTGADFDANGALSAQGTVCGPSLTALLDNPYFQRPWPKSLDRDAFSLEPIRQLSLCDGLATLAAFTVRTLADGLRSFPHLPATIVVAGGGAHNPVLMRMLASQVKMPVRTMDELGLESDFIEAQAFAYCAIRSEKDLAITFPGTTGCQSPLSGGIRALPRT